jgi:hypothetical protein
MNSEMRLCTSGFIDWGRRKVGRMKAEDATAWPVTPGALPWASAAANRS